MTTSLDQNYWLLERAKLQRALKPKHKCRGIKPFYRPIPGDESNLFQTTIYENENEFQHPWHYHPEFELTYILSSHGVRYVGNSFEDFSENDLVLVGSNLPHCWLNTPDPQQQPSSLVTYLKEEFLDRTWMESCEFDAIRKLLQLSGKGIKFDKTVALKLKEKFFKLLRLSSIDKLMMLLEILHELALTTEYHLLCEQEFSSEHNSGKNDRINIVYNYIEQHYQERISLGEIAAHVNMCEAYFSRYFSKIMNKSFFEALNEYKINKACKLLLETDKQISEVCYASGFESIPFFYRQFKKFKNCQPKTFRMSYQKFA